jgi:hypothetical protein
MVSLSMARLAMRQFDCFLGAKMSYTYSNSYPI